MDMKLMRLRLDNFKGIRFFELRPDGRNTAVTGKNKLGKTTIYDAFLWLLFGKNSAGETKFTVKPTFLPAEAENSVEADFIVDGKPMSLKKVYASKFVKSTGEYKSSELECYINGVPRKIREYEAEIAGIISEERFRLLTNPKHFTENLEWKARREILFGIAGNASDSEIASENEDFAEIVTDLQTYGNSTDFLKVITSRIKNNSERINVLPKLINENTANLSGASGNADELASDINSLKTESAGISEKIGSLKVWDPRGTAEYSVIQKKLAELEESNRAYREEQRTRQMDETRELDEKINSLRRNHLDMSAELRETEMQMKNYRMEIETLEDAVKRCEVSEWDGDTVCPVCGQALPEEYVNKAMQEFERSRSEKLKQQRDKIMKLSPLYSSCKDKCGALKNSIAETEKEISALGASRPVSAGFFDLPDYEETAAELKNKLAGLSQLPNPNIGAINDLRQRQEEISKEINDKTILLNALKLDDCANKRISELKLEQKALREDQAKLQKKLDLLNAFIRCKVDKVTGKVNGMFRLTKFKLFEPNKTNDGLTECCEAVAYGASRYGDINTAGKILAGIDIISTLAEKYGISVPLFIDNIDSLDAESCKELTDSISGKMQIITLRVSDDEVLKTEVF